MKTLKILLVALLFISLSATVVMASDAINEAEATFKREMSSGVIYGMESSQPYIIDEWRARIRDLGNGVVEIHEFGHSFGLDDITSGIAIMNINRNRSSIYTAQQDDINGVKASWNR